MKNNNAEIKILVAEDSPSQALSLRYLLEKQGYQVEVANNGKAALELIRQKKPDLVLLDVVMPELDGFDVCRILKKDEQFKLIPVVLVTALNDHESKITGLMSGADEFLSKPVDMAELKARIRSLLNQKLLTDELQNTNDRLIRLDKLKEDLMHMIVHDLRNPLTSIYSTSQILQEGEIWDKDKLLKFFATIFQCSQRMLTMINSLLDIAKMEANQMQLNITRCNVVNISREVGQELMALLEQKDLDYKVNCTGNAEIDCDCELLRRIIVNIVGNGIKFSAQGKSININIFCTEEKMRMEIADQGFGIPTEYHNKIFDKFGQVDGSKDHKIYSTGLGLAFCRMAVEAQGGKIGVKSEIGQGSTFWFELPAKHGFEASPPTTKCW